MYYVIKILVVCLTLSFFSCNSYASDADVENLIRTIQRDSDIRLYTIEYVRVSDSLSTVVNIDEESIVGMCSYRYIFPDRNRNLWGKWYELMNHLWTISFRDDNKSCDMRYGLIIREREPVSRERRGVNIFLCIDGLSDAGTLNGIPVTVDKDFRKWLDTTFPEL